MAAGANVVPFPARAPAQEDAPARSVTRLKKQFKEAVGAKVAENTESAEAEKYFHGIQWKESELKTLKDRGQPVVTFNRIKRKINTICGIIEKLKQDPKAYPRNPQRQAEDGAEIATKTLLYALGWDWRDLSTTVARRTAVRGLSGVELVLVAGDQGAQDPEIAWDEVDQRDFFYDPRSSKHDFSDARFLGTTRWVDIDEALETWPDYADEINEYVDNGSISEHERGDDRLDMTWLNKAEKRVRIVDHWFMVGRKWHYCIYCGSTALEFGQTYLKNEKGEDTHKYEMLSFEIDQDGDRYGAFRDLKSPQDEVNHRRSKALHQLNSRKVVADDGAVDDVEVARREYARADGWVVKNPGKEIQTEDAQAVAVVEGNLKMLEEAKAEIDTYGPNPGLIGSDIPAESGRAIQLLQAAGIAELGTFMAAYKHWKLRVYRKTWCACQQIWTGERWVRVSDDENLQQFIQVNGWQKDEFGNVQILNQLSALDVDIIVEEGPDTMNVMADTMDTILALAKNGAPVPPEMLIELSPLPSSVKQRILQQIAVAQQPKPQDQMMIQAQLGLLQAQIQQLQSQAGLNQAKAVEAGANAQLKQTEAMAGPQPPQIDTPADMAKAALDQAKASEIQHKIQVGAHVPKAQPEEPGLFEVNQARAREHNARADAALNQAQLGVNDAMLKEQQSMADLMLKGAQTAKTREETRTIEQAPPGMLQKPPPRPATTPGKR